MSKSHFKRVGKYMLKYKDKTYYFDGHVNGRQHKLALKSEKRIDAQNEAYALRIKLINEAQFRPTQVRSCGDALQLWWWGPICANPALKKSSKDAYTTSRNLVLNVWPDFESLPLNKVCPADIQNFLSALLIHEHAGKNAKTRKKGLSSSRYNKAISILVKIFTEASRRSLCNPDLLLYLKRQKTKNGHIPLLTAEEYKIFLHKVRQDTSDGARMIELMLLCGARIGELHPIRWRHVEFKDGMMGSVLLTDTKNGENRTIHFNRSLRELFDRLRKESTGDPESRIFKFKTCRKTLVRLCKGATHRVLRHHDLRHIFATFALRAKVTPKAVAAILGHKDGGVLVLRTYGALLEDDFASSMQKTDWYNLQATSP
jgi:integrase